MKTMKYRKAEEFSNVVVREENKKKNCTNCQCEENHCFKW